MNGLVTNYERGFYDGFASERRTGGFDHNYDGDEEYFIGYAKGIDAGRTNMELLAAER